MLCPIRSNNLQKHKLFMVDPHQTIMMSVHFDRGRSLIANISNVAISEEINEYKIIYVEL